MWGPRAEAVDASQRHTSPGDASQWKEAHSVRSDEASTSRRPRKGVPAAAPPRGRGGEASSYERHTSDMARTVVEFLTPLLPTEDEYRIKESTRRQLEGLVTRAAPGAQLLAFGSMANGFALRNSGACARCAD